jgi:hypothetical protein
MLPGSAGAALAVALAVAGCGVGPGESIAAAVRAADLPFVNHVEVSPQNPFQGRYHENVTVYLTGSATSDEVRQVWCEVILPAGPDSLGQGQVRMYRGTIYYANGAQLGAEQLDIPACPGVPPSASPG